MNNIFVNPITFIKEVKSIWRVVLTIMIFQIIFGLIFIVVGTYESWLFDMWFGGMVAAPVGYLVGLIWQIKANGNSWKKHKSIIVFTGICCIMVIVIMPFFPMEHMVETYNQNL